MYLYFDNDCRLQRRQRLLLVKEQLVEGNVTGMNDKIRKIFESSAGAPFLFIGSGFSRRYLGLEDWRGLLERFCEDIREFEYYLSSANGNYPRAATLMAKDFHDVWWSSEKYANSREAYKGSALGVHSALKIEISLYLEELDLGSNLIEDYVEEVETLKNLNVDGVITTNWDLFLEDIFPEYKVFVGQEELLFSNPQSIAEIYKIHGSADAPHSLVLTEDDYDEFYRKNPYLVAKLITIFIEHPIVFIGYSVDDPHISSLIFEIASCLNEDKLDQFSRNLIFLRRANGQESSIETVNFSKEGRSLAALVIKTDDFNEAYRVIAEKKRKIPARILRYCKEQMFELVKSSTPEEKLAVVDINELDEKDDVEFVVGVGVAENSYKKAEAIDATIADSGYSGIERDDLFRDVLQDSSSYNAEKLLSAVYPKLRRSGVFHPIFRYLRETGINSPEELEDSDFTEAALVFYRMSGRSFGYKSYESSFHSKYTDRTAQEIVDELGAEKASIFLAFVPEDKMSNEWLRGFLLDNIDIQFRDPYSSTFKKLICLYDKRTYGF